jgi:hypothetical protein
MGRQAEMEGTSGNLKKLLSYIYQLTTREIIYIIWQKGNINIPETFGKKHEDKRTESNWSCQYSSMYDLLTFLLFSSCQLSPTCMLSQTTPHTTTHIQATHDDDDRKGIILQTAKIR